MDPNANLQQQRQFAADILKEADKDKPNKAIIAGFAVCLAEHQQALDEWIQKGGFYPGRNT